MAAAKAIRRNKPTPKSSSLRSADSSPSQGEPGMAAASPLHGSRVWRLPPLVKGTVSPHKEGSGVQKRQDKTGQELTDDLPRFSVIFELSAQARLTLLLPHSHKRFICILAEPSDNSQHRRREKTHKSRCDHPRSAEHEKDNHGAFSRGVYPRNYAGLAIAAHRDRVILVNDRGDQEEDDAADNGKRHHHKKGNVHPVQEGAEHHRDRPQPDRNERAHPMRVRVRAADEHTERQPCEYEHEHLERLSQYEARGHKQCEYQQRRKRAFDAIGVNLLHFGVGAVSHQHICHNNRQLFHGTHLSGNADTF